MAVRAARTAAACAAALLAAGCGAPDDAPRGAGVATAAAAPFVRPDADADADAVTEDSVPVRASPGVVKTADEEASPRIVVSIDRRMLWLLRGADTLLAAPAGVGKGTTLRHEGRRWTFDTPRGARTVLGKETDPVWVPPDWHFVEAAREAGLALHWLRWDEAVELPSGGVLRVRGGEVVLAWPDGSVDRFRPGQQIVFGGVLYVPPLGSANRRVPGELGSRKLDLGDGYLIHGTRDEASVGGRVTHGCIRLRDADLRALYDAVEVGTAVELR